MNNMGISATSIPNGTISQDSIEGLDDVKSSINDRHVELKNTVTELSDSVDDSVAELVKDMYHTNKYIQKTRSTFAQKNTEMTARIDSLQKESRDAIHIIEKHISHVEMMLFGFAVVSTVGWFALLYMVLR